MNRECRILARRIFVMSMLISEKTKADCFFYYYPHIDGIDVCLYPNGWTKGAKSVQLIESHNGCNEEKMSEVFGYLEDFIANANANDKIAEIGCNKIFFYRFIKITR